MEFSVVGNEEGGGEREMGMPLPCFLHYTFRERHQIKNNITPPSFLCCFFKLVSLLYHIIIILEKIARFGRWQTMAGQQNKLESVWSKVLF